MSCISSVSSSWRNSLTHLLAKSASGAGCGTQGPGGAWACAGSGSQGVGAAKASAGRGSHGQVEQAESAEQEAQRVFRRRRPPTTCRHIGRRMGGFQIIFSMRSRIQFIPCLDETGVPCCISSSFASLAFSSEVGVASKSFLLYWQLLVFSAASRSQDATRPKSWDSS